MKFFIEREVVDIVRKVGDTKKKCKTKVGKYIICGYIVKKEDLIRVDIRNTQGGELNERKN